MKTTTFRCAGRTYDIRVVPHDHHHHEPLPIAQEMIAESSQHGEAKHVDGYLVVLPPETETDSAYRLHTFNSDGEAAAFDGIDALCAYEAYHEANARPSASLALRLGNRVVTLSSASGEEGVVEADLGKPSLDPADANVDVSGFTPIEMPHTFEIELEGVSEPVIVTLVVLEGLHAVIFTQNLEGCSRGSHRAGPSRSPLSARLLDARGRHRFAGRSRAAILARRLGRHKCLRARPWGDQRRRRHQPLHPRSQRRPPPRRPARRVLGRR